MLRSPETDVTPELEASIAEQIASHEVKRAALAEREKTYDLQFEDYGNGNGAGHCWMTEKQLERAALRLTMRTRVSAKDYRLGQSDPGMDASLVASAYLNECTHYAESRKLIHDAAEHIKTNPPLYRPDPAKLKIHPSIQLASGGYFDFLEPHTTPLSIQDIAAALSKMCRYTGHLAIGENEIYTVAQHSVLASENCGEDCDPFEALMHDATESVINDMASPLKQLLPCYKEVEARVESALADYYGLPHEMSKPCKRMDIRMLATEKRDLMPKDEDGTVWAMIKDVEPLPFRIECWGPMESRRRFLHRYYFLTDGCVPGPDEPYGLPHPNAPADYVEQVKREWGDRWVPGGMGQPTMIAA